MMASQQLQDLTSDETHVVTKSGVTAPAKTNFGGQDPYSLFINDPNDEATSGATLIKGDRMTFESDQASRAPAPSTSGEDQIVMTSAFPVSANQEESTPDEMVIASDTTPSTNPQPSRALNAAWKEKLLARQRKYLNPDQLVHLTNDAPNPTVKLPSTTHQATVIPDEAAQQAELDAIQNDFTAAHKEHLRKKAAGQMSEVDEIEFIKVQRAFQAKLKKAKEDLRCEMAELGGDAYESEKDVQMTEGQAGTAASAAEKGYRAFMSVEATNPLSPADTGLTPASSKVKANRCRAAKATAQARSSRGGKGTRGGRVAKPKRPTKKQLEQEKRARNRTNMDNLFSQNLFRDVQTNTAADTGPTFTVNAKAGNKKKDALKQLAS